jgi:RimK family alpha-L-glutamate ligase
MDLRHPEHHAVPTHLAKEHNVRGLRPEIVDEDAFVRPRLSSAARVVLVAGAVTETNALLLRAIRAHGADARFVAPMHLDLAAARGGPVLGRLDVRPSLDGVEDGWWNLKRIELEGAHVLNRTGGLRACHDKLATALMLGRDGVPHPRTALVDGRSDLPSLEWPAVVKPRFGSWGKEVVLIRGRRALDRHLKRISREDWFLRHGALVQEFIPNNGSDLRVVIAGDKLIGTISRVAAPGEWRTNVSLGGIRRPAFPPPEARALALRAVRAVGADFVGVDLLRRPDGSYVVLELNGAVDFTPSYSLGGVDIFSSVARWVLAAATEAVAESSLAGMTAV